MENIIETLNLIKENHEWESNLLDYLEKKPETNDKKDDKYKSFLSEISEMYRKQDDLKRSKEELRKILENDSLVEKIHNCAIKDNRWFFDVKLLRILQKENPYLIYAFLETVMENFVLHFDRLCLEKIESILSDIELEQNDIDGCLQAIDFISHHYVSAFLSKSYISLDFSEKSGIEQIYGDFFSDLIIKNEQILKMNYIIKRIKS